MHPDDGSAQLYRRYGVIAGAAVAGLVVLWFLAPWFTVNPNERAVVTRWGAIARVAEPGLNWKIPLAESTRYFRIDIAEVAPPRGVNTYTVDNQEVDVSFNVFYRIPPDQVACVYQNVPDYRDRLYIMAVDRLKVEMGNGTASCRPASTARRRFPS